jgi:hypothetical protein
MQVIAVIQDKPVINKITGIDEVRVFYFFNFFKQLAKQAVLDVYFYIGII